MIEKKRAGTGLRAVPIRRIRLPGAGVLGAFGLFDFGLGAADQKSA
jgi:hypothetical protein